MTMSLNVNKIYIKLLPFIRLNGQLYFKYWVIMNNKMKNKL